MKKRRMATVMFLLLAVVAHKRCFFNVAAGSRNILIADFHTPDKVASPALFAAPGAVA